MPERFKLVKKKDVLIIIGILITAICIWAATSARFGKAQIPFAEIYIDGSLVKTVYLHEPAVFYVEQLPQVTFEVKNASVAFIRSDCPDQVCVHTGWLDSPGQFAACLPNKATLRVNDAQSSDKVDIILQ